MTDTTTRTGRFIEFGKVISTVMIIATFAGTAWGVIWGPIGDWVSARKADSAAIEKVVEQQRVLQKNQAQLQAEFTNVLSAVAANTEVQAGLVERVELLENRKSSRTKPALRFHRTGHEISDGVIGGQVYLTWRFYKQAECGRPQVDVWLRNGGGVIHRFRDVSILDRTGRGIVFPVDENSVQEITYTAKIPPDESVKPGLAFGWVVIAYPDCPLVKAVTSPEVPFNIVEPPDQ